MALADDPEILRGPIGYAVGINRWGDELDVAFQRQRLAGLLRFVRTFASALLADEFETTIEGYPEPARTITAELRAELRAEGDETAAARQLLSVLIALMELELEHDESSPEDDPEEQEEFHDAILALIGRLLARLETWAGQTGRLTSIEAEAERGVGQWREAAKRLGR